MIAFVDGRLAIKDPTYVIIDVGGIGYEIKISLNTFSAIKDSERCRLNTYFHVKEDAQTLYGFSNLSEKFLFMHLISVSGIGPGTALIMLSSLSVDEVKQAIVNEEVAVIQSVKGIGTKTAQRVILELKDKIKKEGIFESSGGTVSNSKKSIRNEASSALITLGINKAVAEKTIDGILKNASNDISVEELIKLALQRA